MDTKLFLVTEIEGKGLGCVAQKHIKRGTLILREQPCLLLQPGLKNTKYFDDAFHGYEKMDNDQKDMFFDLAHCYDGDDDPDSCRNEVQTCRYDSPHISNATLSARVISDIGRFYECQLVFWWEERKSFERVSLFDLYVLAN